MTLKSNAKFKEKLAFGLKYDMRNLENFHPTTEKSKHFTLMDYFCPKYMKFELKKYSGATFHVTEQQCIIGTNPDLELGELSLEHPKTSEIVN